MPKSRPFILRLQSPFGAKHFETGGLRRTGGAAPRRLQSPFGAKHFETCNRIWGRKVNMMFSCNPLSGLSILKLVQRGLR